MRKMDEVHFESNNQREEIWFESIVAKCLENSFFILCIIYDFYDKLKLTRFL